MLSCVGVVFITLIISSAVRTQDIVCVDASNFTTTIQIDELCIPFLHGTVFVNTTQQSVDVTLSSTLRVLQLAPQNCAVKVIELTCQTYFPFCNILSTPTTPPILLPSPACKSKCLNAITACTSFVQENHELFDSRPDLLPPDCNVKDNDIERWPSSNIEYNISGLSVEVICNSFSPDGFVETKPSTCPYVMSLLESPSPSEAPCPIKCPLPVFPAEEWESDMHWAYIIAWVSLFSLLFLIISFLLVKNKRQFPQNLFINLFFALLMCCVFIIAGALSGPYKLMCHNKQPSTQKYAPCGLQGSMMFYFSLCASCWWFCIVVNLYIMIRDAKRVIPVQNQKYYYAFGYGFPTLVMVIALGLNGFGYYAPNIICFLPIDGDRQWMQYALFYVPIGCMTVVGAVLNVLIIIKLLQAYFSVKRQTDKQLGPYFKISFFVVAFLFIWIAIFTRMSVADSTEVESSFMEFVLCHVTYFSLRLDSVQYCGKVPKVQPNVKILHLLYVAETVHGIFAFFLFCYDKDLYAGWLAAFREIHEKVKKRSGKGKGGKGGKGEKDGKEKEKTLKKVEEEMLERENEREKGGLQMENIQTSEPTAGSSVTEPPSIIVSESAESE